MKVLVTGGAGFIGSHIAKELLRINSDVYILDNLSTGLKENIPDQSKFINFDVSKEKDYVKIKNLKNIDAVLHLAAQSSGEISFDNPVYDMEVNIKGTLLLLEWCRNNNVNRFIEASSLMVYGEPLKLPLKESMKCYPKSFYAVGKLATENYLKLYSQNFGINYTVFRMSNVYGPGQNLNNLRQGMVSIYLAYLLKNQPLIIKGSIDRFRDFIYIDDVVKYWLKAIDNNKSYNKIYNLGVGYSKTVKELLETMFKILNLELSKYNVKIDKETPGDILGNYCSIKELINDFKIEPEYDLENGLKKMIKSYSSLIK